jgi:hypothetical protein
VFFFSVVDASSGSTIKPGRRKKEALVEPDEVRRQGGFGGAAQQADFLSAVPESGCRERIDRYSFSSLFIDGHVVSLSFITSNGGIIIQLDIAVLCAVCRACTLR